jgi:hypothetical protein
MNRGGEFKFRDQALLVGPEKEEREREWVTFGSLKTMCFVMTLASLLTWGQERLLYLSPTQSTRDLSSQPPRHPKVLPKHKFNPHLRLKCNPNLPNLKDLGRNREHVIRKSFSVAWHFKP